MGGDRLVQCQPGDELPGRLPAADPGVLPDDRLPPAGPVEPAAIGPVALARHARGLAAGAVVVPAASDAARRKRAAARAEPCGKCRPPTAPGPLRHRGPGQRAAQDAVRRVVVGSGPLVSVESDVGDDARDAPGAGAGGADADVVDQHRNLSGTRLAADLSALRLAAALAGGAGGRRGAGLGRLGLPLPPAPRPTRAVPRSPRL